MAEQRDIRLITFDVGPERFVYDIMAVREILMYGGTTTIPRLPSFIEGVIVLRNEVIPVVDLRGRLFPGAPPLDKTPLVLICRSEFGTLGLKVDAVREIVNVSTEKILPPPDLIRGLQGDLFIGVVQHKDRVYLLVDLRTLLTPEEKATIRETDVTLAEVTTAGESPS